jgi:hypothetical protein
MISAVHSFIVNKLARKKAKYAKQSRCYLTKIVARVTPLMNTIN